MTSDNLSQDHSAAVAWAEKSGNRKYVQNTYSYGAQKNGQWKEVTAYGGLITENVVQALARDLMVDAMFRCEAAGYPVVLTVHDEIVCEVETGRADVKVLQQIMEDRPQWAIDMQVPVAAECWVGDRYRK
jgi:DNA polymerase